MYVCMYTIHINVCIYVLIFPAPHSRHRYDRLLILCICMYTCLYVCIGIYVHIVTTLLARTICVCVRVCVCMHTPVPHHAMYINKHTHTHTLVSHSPISMPGPAYSNAPVPPQYYATQWPKYYHHQLRCVAPPY